MPSIPLCFTASHISLDLNKMNNEELDTHKKKMDELYYKNYKDPKAKDFVYEIEVGFSTHFC